MASFGKRCKEDGPVAYLLSSWGGLLLKSDWETELDFMMVIKERVINRLCTVMINVIVNSGITQLCAIFFINTFENPFSTPLTWAYHPIPMLVHSLTLILWNEARIRMSGISFYLRKINQSALDCWSLFAIRHGKSPLHWESISHLFWLFTKQKYFGFQSLIKSARYV